jgi:arylsulfatase
MPTILDVAGVEFTPEINGRSVVAMQGSSVADFISGNVKTPYSGAGQVGYELFGMKAFFDGDWKILWMPPPFGTGDWQLYNLREDPGEIVDLSDQHSEWLVKMIAQWERYKEENGVLDISYALSGDE